jgi:hypothetical protein
MRKLSTAFVLVFLMLALGSAAVSLAQLQSPLPSPNATVSQNVGVTKIEVAYSRPHVKGPTRKEDRVIWGKLVPYGEVWRTGANNVTKFTIDTDITVEGQKLPAGSYALYTMPGQTEWAVIFNKQTTTSPADYKAENDALRVKVKPQASEMHELFTIEFPKASSDSAVMVLAWEKLAVPVNISTDTNALYLKKAKEAVAAAKPDDWRTPANAARYLSDNNYAPADATAFLEKSLAIKQTFGNVSIQASMLAAAGKKKEAAAAGQKALSLKEVDPKPSPEAVADMEKKVAEWKGAK